MARVRQIDTKTWHVEGASVEEVAAATKRASARRTPIDHGGLPLPMRLGLKAMVGLTTYDTYGSNGTSGAKTHFMGPSVYQTKVKVEQKGNVVEVRRKTRGLLAPAAEVGTNLGRAIEAELNRRR